MRPILLDVARVATAVYLVLMMLAMGLELGDEPAPNRAAKQAQRRLVVRALAFNLLLLPLLAVTLTQLLRVSDDVAIAFLLLAAAPGGRFMPHLAHLAGVPLALSVEITLFLAKLVPFTAPLAAHWMLHTHRLELHELRFIAQLAVLQLLPYLLGRQLRKRRPALATRLERPVALAMWCGLVALLALTLATHELRGVLALLGDRGWWAVLIFALAAPGLGWLVGGPRPQTRLTFALSANARNLALALLLAQLAFADRAVQVAAFAAWLVLLGIDLGCAKLARVTRTWRPPVDNRALTPLPRS
jgi:BASS family bile acid:Na+ symporter